VVWYYRESAQAQPPPEATRFVDLVIKYRLPIGFSTKADFSDAYDPSTGSSVPR
jgi:hypothetical protein